MPEPSSSTAFVGRRSELAAFDRAVEVARLGRPGVLLVGGDAGIGKSTLVAEGARRAGADLFVGRCVPMGGEVIPLAPLVELLRNVRRSIAGGAERTNAGTVAGLGRTGFGGCLRGTGGGGRAVRPGPRARRVASGRRCGGRDVRGSALGRSR